MAHQLGQACGVAAGLVSVWTVLDMVASRWLVLDSCQAPE